MKTYEAVFNEENKGVYGISLVENPAMEGDFIALSKHTDIKLKTVDEEQRILMGLVLEPNKPIYRNQDGEEFNIVFSEQTVKDLSHNFFKQNYQHNSTIEHDNRIEGVTFVESWIVEDSKVDKSANFGFSYPKGSWLATMKVDNDDIWNNYVKTGKVLGFSVDAFVTLKEVKLNNHKMDVKSITDAIKSGFESFNAELKAEKEAKIKLGSVNTAEGIAIMFDGEELTQGATVWVEAEGERVAVPVGEIQLEDGRMLIIAEEGVVSEIREQAQEEAPAEMNQEDTKSVAQEISEQIKSVLIKYSEDLDAKFEKFKAEFSKENEELKSKVVELGEQPVSTPKKVVVTDVKLNKKGRLLEKLRQNK